MDREVDVKIWTDNVGIPQYAYDGDAGFDFYAKLEEPIYCFSGETYKVPTGIFMAIPDGYELDIRSRSGNALNGLVVANSPGTIDSTYRGEICILLHNNNREAKVINNHDKIAQGVLLPVYRAVFAQVDTVEKLGSSERGSNGFGSTGK